MRQARADNSRRLVLASRTQVPRKLALSSVKLPATLTRVRFYQGGAFAAPAEQHRLAIDN